MRHVLCRWKQTWLWPHAHEVVGNAEMTENRSGKNGCYQISPIPYLTGDLRDEAMPHPIRFGGTALGSEFPCERHTHSNYQRSI